MRLIMKRSIRPLCSLIIMLLSATCAHAAQDFFEETWTALDGLTQSMCEKFDQTWTILQDIDDKVDIVHAVACQETDDIKNTFTALDELQQSLCEKFDQTWTIIAALPITLADALLDGFEQTWTALDEVADQLCVKFDGTTTIFTSPGGLFDNATELNETIVTNEDDAQEAFASLWSDLDAFEQRMCDLFEETWTQFEDPSAEILTGFEQTWTALEELEQNVCQKFAETGTMLTQANILLGGVDLLSGMLTMSQLVNFRQTWTALTEISQTACEKFEQTWTILPGIEQLAGSLGEQEFEQTWTAIDEVNAVLCRKFEQTWTIFDALIDTATALASAAQNSSGLDAALDGTFTALEKMGDDLCDKFEGTWTMFSCLGEDVTPITSGPIIITIPGVYRLMNDLEITSGGGIAVVASDVVIDLNNKRIIDDSGGSTDDGISVGAGVSNVSIKDGTIEGFTRGIEVLGAPGNEVEKLTVQNICIRDSISEGLFINFADYSLFKDIVMVGAASSGTEAFVILNCCNTTISSLKIHDSGPHTGGDHVLLLSSCEYCIFDGIEVHGAVVSGNSNSSIFRCSTITNSIFNRCLSCDIDSQLSSARFMGTMILNATSLNNLIKECCASTVNSTNNSIGFDAEGGANFNVFEKCVVQDFNVVDPSARVLGFTTIGDSNMFNKCVVEDIVLDYDGAGARECYGFYAFSNAAALRSIFKECDAQRVRSAGTSSTVTVAGFRMGGSADQAVFLDCRALANENPNSAGMSYGFFDDGTNNAIYARCTASNNSTTLANQLGLGAATESDTWANTRAGLGAALPSTEEPFSSLGTTG